MQQMLYGRQTVTECLRASRRRINRVIIRRGAKAGDELDALRQLAAEKRVPLDTADQPWFNRLGHDVNHQGVAAEVGAYPYVHQDDALLALRELGKPPLVLLLDHIQDPQNLGALLRSAEAAGVDAVFIPADRAAAVTPAAVRASAGASEHLRVVMATNLVRVMSALKEENVWLYGLESVPEATLYSATDFSGGIGIVVGSEGEGLGRLVRETCDGLLSIPMQGAIGSLNAGVAGAIVLFEVQRQRGLKT
jgi:23S rRNA (guanosine2251-2'-O)-methyltransferase